MSSNGEKHGLQYWDALGAKAPLSSDILKRQFSLMCQQSGEVLKVTGKQTS